VSGGRHGGTKERGFGGRLPAGTVPQHIDRHFELRTGAIRGGVNRLANPSFQIRQIVVRL
jgi:hypothetical protein